MATDLVAYTNQHLKDRLVGVADQLRRMAAEVEQLQSRVEHDPTSAASNAVHTVMWGVANLNLDSLISYSAAALDARKDT